MTRPKKQPATQSPGSNTNRYDSLDETPSDVPKPSYSDVASSHRVSDLTISKPEQNQDQVPEPSMSALMAAIQGLGSRLTKLETTAPPDDSTTPDSSLPSQNPVEFDRNCPPHDEHDHIDDDDEETCNDTRVPSAPTSRRGNFRNNFRPPASAESPQNYLNQNEFYVAISGGNKIKYAEMEKYIFQKVLLDDSAEALKKVYSSIGRMIAYGFSTQFTLMPAFKDLDRDTEFEKNFFGWPIQ